MKKFSKVLALGLAATMLGGAFVGCSKPAETAPAPTEKPAEEKPAAEAAPAEAAPVTLKTVTQFGGTDPKGPLYQEKIKAFQEANPNVTIEDQSATADEQWKSMVLTDFAAGNEPDVIFFFTDINSKTLVEENKVVSVEEIRAEYPDYGKDILPAAMASAACSDGKQYALPITGYYEGLYCNKDLFDKYSLELPTDWAKFETAVKTFAENGVTPMAVGLGHIPHYLIEHFLLAEGGVADHTNKDITAVKETWVKGLTLFKTLSDMGAFPKDTATAQHEIMQQQFINKQAAMFIDGSWFNGQITDQENTVIIPMPGTGNGKKDPTEIIAGFSSGYYITRKAWDDPAKRDAAVKFVSGLTTTDVIAEFQKVGGGEPAAKIVIENNAPINQKGSDMLAAATASDPAVDSWVKKAAWDYLLGKVPGIAAGKEDPAAVVDEVIKLNTAQ